MRKLRPKLSKEAVAHWDIVKIWWENPTRENLLIAQKNLEERGLLGFINPAVAHVMLQHQHENLEDPDNWIDDGNYYNASDYRTACYGDCGNTQDNSDASSWIWCGKESAATSACGGVIDNDCYQQCMSESGGYHSLCQDVCPNYAYPECSLETCCCCTCATGVAHDDACNWDDLVANPGGTQQCLFYNEAHCNSFAGGGSLYAGADCTATAYGGFPPCIPSATAPNWPSVCGCDGDESADPNPYGACCDCAGAANGTWAEYTCACDCSINCGNGCGEECYGCMDSEACNVDPMATLECTDPTTQNGPNSTPCNKCFHANDYCFCGTTGLDFLNNSEGIPYCNCIGDLNDCASVCGGTAVLDECGECDGDGPEEGYNCNGTCSVPYTCAENSLSACIPGECATGAAPWSPPWFQPRGGSNCNTYRFKHIYCCGTSPRNRLRDVQSENHHWIAAFHPRTLEILAAQPIDGNHGESSGYYDLVVHNQDGGTCGDMAGLTPLFKFWHGGAPTASSHSQGDSATEWPMYPCTCQGEVTGCDDGGYEGQPTGCVEWGTSTLTTILAYQEGYNNGSYCQELKLDPDGVYMGMFTEGNKIVPMTGSGEVLFTSTGWNTDSSFPAGGLDVWSTSHPDIDGFYMDCWCTWCDLGAGRHWNEGQTQWANCQDDTQCADGPHGHGGGICVREGDIDIGGYCSQWDPCYNIDCGENGQDYCDGLGNHHHVTGYCQGGECIESSHTTEYCGAGDACGSNPTYGCCCDGDCTDAGTCSGGGDGCFCGNVNCPTGQVCVCFGGDEHCVPGGPPKPCSEIGQFGPLYFSHECNPGWVAEKGGQIGSSRTNKSDNNIRQKPRGTPQVSRMCTLDCWAECSMSNPCDAGYCCTTSMYDMGCCPCDNTCTFADIHPNCREM